MRFTSFVVEILHVHDVLQVKNYGIWLRYDSRTNTHNMYKASFWLFNISGEIYVDKKVSSFTYIFESNGWIQWYNPDLI